MIGRRSAKGEKEAFVTGHAGSDSPWEILLICLSAPIGLVTTQIATNIVTAALLSSLSARTSSHTDTVQAKGTGHDIVIKNRGNERQQKYQRRWISYLSFVLEALLLWVPMILCQSSHLYSYGILVLSAELSFVVVIVAVATTKLTRRNSITQRPTNEQEQQIGKQHQAHSTSGKTTIHKTAINAAAATTTEDNSRRLVITAYRSTLMLLTIIAILAVDFPFFPRRHCKTEEYGFGLMDLGAASFAFSYGLVSRHAKQYQYQRQPNRAETTYDKATDNGKLRKQWIHIMPLLMIGMIRLFTNKSVDYQEHVSEYGVHWNFFFTLGVLIGIPSLVQPSATLDKKITQQHERTRTQQPDIRRSFAVGVGWKTPIAILIMYQMALSVFHLQEFIESAPRIFFLSTINDSSNDDINKVASNNESTADTFSNKNTVTGFLRYEMMAMKSYLHQESSPILSVWFNLLGTACDFFLANREGILGCIGYLSIYWMGQVIGKDYIFYIGGKGSHNVDNTKTDIARQARLQRPSLWKLALILWLGFVLATSFACWLWNNHFVNSGGETDRTSTMTMSKLVSRRSTNAWFCWWVVAHNVTLLCLLELVVDYAFVNVVVMVESIAPVGSKWSRHQEEGISKVDDDDGAHDDEDNLSINTTAAPPKGTLRSKPTFVQLAASVDTMLSSSSRPSSSSASSSLAQAPPKQVLHHFPYVFTCINRYGLIFFLTANILTGLVNLTIPTLEWTTDSYAMVVVAVYLLCNGVMAMIVDQICLPLYHHYYASTKSNDDETATTTNTKPNDNTSKRECTVNDNINDKKRI